MRNAFYMVVKQERTRLSRYIACSRVSLAHYVLLAVSATLLTVEALLLLAQGLLVALLELRLLLWLILRCKKLCSYLLVIYRTTNHKHNDHCEDL